MMKSMLTFLSLFSILSIVASTIRSSIGAREMLLLQDKDKLPDGLVAVEYIESSGTQYIDTGIPLYSTMWIEIDFQISSWVNNAVVCGSNVSGSTSKGQYSIGMFSYSGHNYITSNYNAFTGALSDVSPEDRLTVGKHENITYYNGTSYERPKVETYYAGGNCFLFWGGGYHSTPFTNKSRIKIYAFTLYDGGIICRCQPVRFLNENEEWEGAMYDFVSKQLFRNSGTGSFTFGPDAIVEE